MFSENLFGDPNAVSISTLFSYEPSLGHWVVQFVIGVTPIWAVGFADMCDRDIDIEDRFEMRKTALELFARELQRRLLGD